MAFTFVGHGGYSGTYLDPNTGQPVHFEGPFKDWEKTVRSLPDGTIQQLQLYDHGAPGEISGQEADYLAMNLSSKMSPGSTVELVACNSAGLWPQNSWNPLQGWNSGGAVVLYDMIPRFTDDQTLADRGGRNLAQDLSARLPGVQVTGYAGFSFPLSRLPEVLRLKEESYSPSLIMGSPRTYMNGQECESLEKCAAPTASAAAKPGGTENAGAKGGNASTGSSAKTTGTSGSEKSANGTNSQSKLSSKSNGPSATNVTANNEKIAHLGSCHLAKTNGATDVCWAGGEDEPAAFENIGYMTTLVDATISTLVSGNPVWIKPARLATSMASHPEKPNGVSSQKPHMNEVRATNASKDVIFEGQGVVRTNDATTQDKKNTTGKVAESAAPAKAGQASTALTPEEKARLEKLLSDPRAVWTKEDRELARREAQNMINGATQANARLENVIRLTQLIETATGAKPNEIAHLFGSSMGRGEPWDQRPNTINFNNTTNLVNWRDVKWGVIGPESCKEVTISVSHTFAAVSMESAPYAFNAAVNHSADIVDGVIKGVKGWQNGNGFSMSYGYGDANQYGDWYGNRVAFLLTLGWSLSDAMRAAAPDS